MLRPEIFMPAVAWVPPTGEEVAAVVRLVGERRGEQMTGTKVAQLLGLSEKNGARTYRLWVSGEGAPIPYSAWCILAYEAGYQRIWSKSK